VVDDNDIPPPNESVISSLLGRLKDSGEQVVNEISQQLLENPTFLAALRRSIEAKDRVAQTISGTMDFVNLPSKNDVAAVMALLERLSLRMSTQQRSLAAIEQRLDQMKAALDALSAAVQEGTER
jgi:ribosomal 50S subunit-associated protein YjgA (DUF615 family)